jgi:hypothetical protein
MSGKATSLSSVCYGAQGSEFLFPGSTMSWFHREGGGNAVARRLREEIIG